MARTKQTARKALVAAPLARQIAKSSRGGTSGRGRGKGGKRVGSRSRSRSSEFKEEEAVNTQQFSLKFDDQDKCEQSAIEGQIIFCKACGAVFTNKSSIEVAKPASNKKLSDAERQAISSEKLWNCEFCAETNYINSKYQVPTIDNPCYLIQTNKKVGKVKTESRDLEATVIFCIDISGSMEYDVAGKSRINSVKEAISEEISRMKAEKEKVKIGLITFGSSVNYYGDKGNEGTKIESDVYNSFEGMVNHAKSIKQFSQSLGDSFKSLKDVISNLNTFGSTALGPALVLAIELASRSRNSKIILCTDGEANVGIGSSLQPGFAAFYSQAARFAKEKGVMISILSLKGDNCNLKELGKLSLATEGSVLKINPAALGTEFKKIMKEEILGSESKLKVIMNRIFELVQFEQGELSNGNTTLTQDYGNFTAQTELAFQFKVLDETGYELKYKHKSPFHEKKSASMQIQLSYTGRNGNRYLQIINDERLLTRDVTETYQGMHFGLFSASALQRASRHIKDKEYDLAKNVIKSFHSLVASTFSKTESKAQLTKFTTRVNKLDDILNSKRVKADLPLSRKKSGDRKSKKTNEPKKKLIKKTRRRGGVSNSSCSSSSSRSRDDNADMMASDSMEEVLYRQMRARSCSASPSSD